MKFFTYLYRVLPVMAMMLLLWSCSDDEGFKVGGKIEGLGDRGVEMYYYVGGGIKMVETVAHDGKFVLHGESPAPTLVTLSLTDRTLLTYLVAKDGESITIEGSLDKPFGLNVKGSKVSSAMARFVRDNAAAMEAGNQEAVNEAVARYIGSHRSDMASAALLVTRFHTPGHELLADSLLGLLAPEVRPAPVMQNFSSVLSRQLSADARGDVASMSLYAGRDSLVKLIPSRQSYAMLAFVADNRRQRDSVNARLRGLSSFPASRFKALEVSMAPDSASWRRSIEGDSVGWMRAWLPGGVAAPQIRRLSVPRVPFFIVCDSTGHQLYRGSSVSEAADIINDRLRAK